MDIRIPEDFKPEKRKKDYQELCLEKLVLLAGFIY